MSPARIVPWLASSLLACSRGGPQTTPPTAATTDVAVTEPAAGPSDAAPAGELVLPTRFESQRIFLELKTAEGQPLRLFTDTGGGLYLHDHVAERLGLPIEQTEGDGGQPIEVVTLPSLHEDTPMPPLLVLDGRLPVAREELLDTGATVLLTEPGLAGLGDDGPSERATSFIVRSVFDRWRRAHPQWRVIEDADRMAGDPMIEVPTVTVDYPGAQVCVRAG